MCVRDCRTHAFISRNNTRESPSPLLQRSQPCAPFLSPFDRHRHPPFVGQRPSERGDMRMHCSIVRKTRHGCYLANAQDARQVKRDRQYVAMQSDATRIASPRSLVVQVRSTHRRAFEIRHFIFFFHSRYET